VPTIGTAGQLQHEEWPSFAAGPGLDLPSDEPQPDLCAELLCGLVAGGFHVSGFEASPGTHLCDRDSRWGLESR
jgi:hypothetical protein